MFFKKSVPQEKKLLAKLKALATLPLNTSLKKLDQVLRADFYEINGEPNRHFVKCSFPGSLSARNTLAGHRSYTKKILMCLYRHNTGSEDLLDDEFLYEAGTYISDWDSHQTRKLPNILSHEKESFAKSSYRIDRLKSARKVIRASIDYFSSTWKFKLYIASTSCLYPVYSHLPNKEAKNKNIERLTKQALPLIEQGERNINQVIRHIMADEIPKMQTLEDILQALTRIEQDRQDRYDELKAHYEEKLQQALKQQLAEVESKHKEQLIEMHETVSRLQDMIDKTFQQNELLLEAQKNQGKDYENQLFGLLERLKNA